ncbi:MAG: MliC family protein [Rickettsiales bacterium]|jgi:membrane-bound inhibitor of C-type lysozyme|nr:MliC family protein [Rickettsiales bacterium]
MMKKILFSLLAAFVLVGCNNSEDVMKCGDYDVKIAQVGENDLKAVLNGDEVVLAQTVSASGARYEGVLNDTTIVLWGKGDDWTLFLNEETPIECK